MTTQPLLHSIVLTGMMSVGLRAGAYPNRLSGNRAASLDLATVASISSAPVPCARDLVERLQPILLRTRRRLGRRLLHRPRRLRGVSAVVVADHGMSRGGPLP